MTVTSVSITLAIVLLSALADSNQRIGIVLLDSDSRKPLRAIDVNIYLGEPTKPGTAILRAKTDESGTAIFEVNNPLPPKLFVAPANAEACSPGWFSTSEVLEKGSVAQDQCHHKHKVKITVSAKPGKIVLFGKKWTRWREFKSEMPH